MRIDRSFVTSLSLGAAFILASSTALAQCNFDPTVAPSNLILCPNTQGVLMTEVYDSYQWYKDGNPIPGATDQTLIVDAYNDSGSQFSVEATAAGCTEMSPQVLVDGWAFLPPTVLTEGESLYFTQNGPVFCALDTVLLVLLQPYDINIQWTDGGVPIPGATDDTLAVHNTGGVFNVSGAPAICPNFVQDPGLWMWIGFTQPVQPDIVESGSQLCAYPEGESYQWYLDDLPLSNSNSACIDVTVSGSYLVDVTYVVDCSTPSEAFLITGLDEQPDARSWQAYPVPAADLVNISWGDGSLIHGWRLHDATGRMVAQQNGAMRSPCTVDVSGLSAGRYWLNAGGAQVIPVSVVR
ncbi:MAG: T9SS type A sorting domain-containing protein [Flavobacteriales bacterium]|nr:T9SS type A sorting domain-containing protein [Flavobacteriales bacterium]MCC6937216.1 T9SS type A sorting domain-containing protein [Flavobacteriales bacterium]